MKMKIAELNKRIQIIRNTLTENDNGVDEETEVILKEVWAKVQNMSGTEIFKANSDFSKVTTRFVIRYLTDITTDDYIKFEDRKYNIVYINNYNFSNDFIEIVGELIV